MTLPGSVVELLLVPSQHSLTDSEAVGKTLDGSIFPHSSCLTEFHPKVV